MKKRAIILTWSGFQDQEVVYPYYRLLGDGFEVEIIADKRDDLNRVYGIFGLNMPCHVLMSDFTKKTDIWLNEANLLVIPGGVKALEKLRQETEVKNFISRWNKNGKLIASTCHGAQMLISAKVTQGRRISGYYSLEDDIVNSGAFYSRDPVVIDGNIISSPHYDHMGLWMEETLKLFYQMCS